MKNKDIKDYSIKELESEISRCQNELDKLQVSKTEREILSKNFNGYTTADVKIEYYFDNYHKLWNFMPYLVDKKTKDSLNFYYDKDLILKLLELRTNKTLIEERRQYSDLSNREFWEITEENFNLMDEFISVDWLHESMENVYEYSPQSIRKSTKEDRAKSKNKVLKEVKDKFARIGITNFEEVEAF